MKLHYRRTGAGAPLVILHGLFGSLNNWQSLARVLADHRSVYTLDQRNHGHSPHHDDVSYEAMARDLVEFLELHRLGSAPLVGHSMGGKTAMLTALRYPSRVPSLVVIDIAPRAYPRGHDDFFSALGAIDPGALSSREEADTLLAPALPDPLVRHFLLTNLRRLENGTFAWRMNLDALRRGYDGLLGAIESDRPYAGSALFIRGDRSPYIAPDDHPLIKRLFPSARIVTVPGSGHWVHADQPRLLAETIESFLP